MIAAFDVDGTLTTTDCVVPFLRRFTRRPALALGALRNARHGALALARRDRDRLRAAATAAVLAGVDHDTVASEAEQFIRLVIAGRLRPDTMARLDWHRRNGHRVVLVSASYEVYLVLLADHLGAEAALATRLEVGADGRCTGRLDGRNCRGEEKVRRLHAWLDEQGLRRADVVVWAYGDSVGDRELLADADHAVHTRGDIGPID